MKKIIYILIGLFILCASTDSYGQLFNKRRKGYASVKKGSDDTYRKRDPFSRKNKKKPNIDSSGGPNTKSKSKLYRHSTSKKKNKRKQSIFSSRKRTHKSVVSSNKRKGADGSKNSSVGRKSRKGRNRK